MTADLEARLRDNVIFTFDDPRAETIRRLTEWAADQREREAWGDKDRSTYRYCAETLEAAAALSAGCQHVPLDTAMQCLGNRDETAEFVIHKHWHPGMQCPGPHKTLYVQPDRDDDDA